MNPEKKPMDRPEGEEKDTMRRSNTRNKEWICMVCNFHNYTLSGRCKHLSTKKHRDAVNRIIMNKIINILHKNKTHSSIDQCLAHLNSLLNAPL